MTSLYVRTLTFSRKSDGSSEGRFDEESEGKHSIRSTPKSASSKAASRIAFMTKAFSRDLLGKRVEEEPRHLGRPGVDYMMARLSQTTLIRKSFPQTSKSLQYLHTMAEVILNITFMPSSQLFGYIVYPTQSSVRFFQFFQGTARK